MTACVTCSHFPVCSRIMGGMNLVQCQDYDEVRYGEWLKINERQFMDGSNETLYECSLCHRDVSVAHEHYILSDKVVSTLYPYCHCGAKMTGGKVI